MLKSERNKKALIWIATAVFVLGLLAGCGGKSSKKEAEAEELGSLKRTFTLMDEQGRRSGQLTIAPSGMAELTDANGETMATFSLSEKPAEKPAEATSEKTEAKEEKADKEEKEEKKEEAKE